MDDHERQREERLARFIFRLHAMDRDATRRPSKRIKNPLSQAAIPEKNAAFDASVVCDVVLDARKTTLRGNET
jgi:hypothetical protein